MNGKLTIKQIADLAGVSVAAVSYALNGKKGISDTTRKRILDAIDNTNYTPNVNSRRLILQRSFNILLVIDAKASPFDNFFYIEIINSIVENGMRLGYNTVLAKLADCFETSVLKNTLMQHNADGIIFLCDIESDIRRGIDEIGTPFVVVDSQKSNPSYPNVHASYREASCCAVRYLIENGHKKIAMLDAGDVAEYYMCTLEGYKEVLIENGIELNPKWIRTDVHDEISVQSYMEEIAKGDDVPTAFFCSSDFVAINLMNYLQRKGYVLPEDFSICSIDDIVLARYHFPTLTTVKIDKILMGKLAVDMLDKLIRGEETPTNITVPACELMARDSVKNISM